jgi:two-component system sensor histidine kinase ChvG
MIRAFSDPGGELRVSLRHVEADGREGYEIRVDDDGPGVPDHALERIFERFYTDRPSQSFGQNSGLGLSISRQIVEAHGGSIRATNRLDESGEVLGACFIVFLPAAKE